MMDLIDRQAAIDALYHVDEYNGRSVEVIRNLPSAPRWIPVAERLPKSGEQVLVTVWRNGVIIAWLDTDNCWRSDEFNLDADEVDAWQPLPEPWKGEDDAQVH